MRILAELFAVVETETPYGGRIASHEAMGVCWLRPGARRRSLRGEEDPPRAVDALMVETRADPRLAPGRMLRFEGADWRVQAVEPTRPGRARLRLERDR